MTDTLESATYAKLQWNTPLAEDHADLLLNRLDLSAGTTLVDLGCGWGELLLRGVARSGGAGIGIDTNAAALERGRGLAQARGLHDRVTLVEADVASWSGTADRAICIGTAHALGGTRTMLAALSKVVARGRVLVGDGYWASTPTQAALGIFGDQILSLADLVSACRETGWRALHLSTADLKEWDDFEFRHRAGRQEWLLANPDDPRAADVRALLDTREREYLEAYRGVLGFAYLVLAR